MQKNKFSSLQIIKIQDNKKEKLEDIVVREYPLTIFLNNRELVTLLCTPSELKELTIGFLSSEGFIKSKEDIENIFFEKNKKIVKIEIRDKNSISEELFRKRSLTSGCGRGTIFYNTMDFLTTEILDSESKISAGKILELNKEFQNKSETFKLTGGVHSAALTNSDRIIFFSEDIGRHNAIDKIFGKVTLKEISTSNKIVFTSGRISSEILIKVAKRKVPILVSRSAPTDLAINLGKKLNITLIGFLRGKRMNIYSGEKRII